MSVRSARANISESHLRRVPDGHPIAINEQAPILLAAQGILAGLLMIGVTAQLIWLRRHRAARHPGATA